MNRAHRFPKLGTPSEITLVCLLLCAMPAAVSGQSKDKVPTSASDKQVSYLLRAYEQDDFKTIFDISYSYQQQVQIIKQANPQAMWKSLTDEYFGDVQEGVHHKRSSSDHNILGSRRIVPRLTSHRCRHDPVR